MGEVGQHKEGGYTIHRFISIKQHKTLRSLGTVGSVTCLCSISSEFPEKHHSLVCDEDSTLVSLELKCFAGSVTWFDRIIY